MKNFALIGVAGFVAKRHLEAIRQTGNNLVAAMDRSDSVGILDQYFPGARFTTDPDEFRKDLRNGSGTDYLSVCTPNDLHKQHIALGLEEGAKVICEKPLVLHPSDAEWLLELQKRTGGQVFNLLQLRLHPDIIRLKEKAGALSHKKTNIDLTYITPRGSWYHKSWKGDERRSGGIATNIGIHFFDMLIWIFGSVQNSVVHLHGAERASGFLELERARVRWYLSIRSKDLPASNTDYSYRSVGVDGEDIEFSSGFTGLHTASYEAILASEGFSLEEALPSLQLVSDIRQAATTGLKGDWHPMAGKQ